MATAMTNINWQMNMRTLSDSAKHLFNNPAMSDITFQFKKGDEITGQIFAHSWLLSMLSPVYYQTFKNNFEVAKEIPVSEMTYNVLLECLKFIYTSECNINNDNVFSIMSYAKQYSLKYLEKNCADHINKTTTINSVCPSLDRVISFNLGNAAKDKLLKFLAPKFCSVLQTKSFLTIKNETLKTIFDMDEIESITEFEIFVAAMKWAENQCNIKKLTPDGTNKRLLLSDTVKMIRFPLMTASEFGQCLKQEKGLLTFEEEHAILMNIATKERNTVGFSNKRRKFITVNSNNVTKSSEPVAKGSSPVKINEVPKKVEPLVKKKSEPPVTPKTDESTALKTINNIKGNSDSNPIKTLKLFSSNQKCIFSHINPSQLIPTKFEVNRDVNITSISVGVTDIDQYLYLKIWKSKNLIYYNNIEVKKNEFIIINLPQSDVKLISANIEYTIDITFSCSDTAKFQLVNLKNLPFTKSLYNYEFTFTEYSQLLWAITFDTT